MFTGEQSEHLTTFMNKPHNIIAIDRVSASQLTGFQRIGTESVKISADVSWQSINIKVPARLIISDKIEDGVRLHTSQLIFRTCESVRDLKRYVYRCRTADGNYILIGAPERPYPVGTVTVSHPDNMTDSQLDEISVSWTSGHRIPYII